MLKRQEPFFGLISGTEPVDQKQLAKFTEEMNREVIPNILKIIEKRQLSAVETRTKQLKC